LPTYPVKGRVVFNGGGEVHVGTVELKSKEHPTIQARGTIETDGSFTLSTYEPNDGAIAGDHDCVVVQMVMAENVKSHRPSKVGIVDRKHASYATSGLRAQIKAGPANELELKVDGILQKQPDSHQH
jgi:hypothetical protein